MSETVKPDGGWTNPSVLAFADGEDPVAKVATAARRMVLEGLEAGWDGPPFDPFDLAHLLGHRIRAERLPVDARLVADGDGLTILYNPARPAARVRFSVAHELGHLLFDDAADAVRERTPRGALPAWDRSDDYQLEVLCNVAAAEILMPFETLDDLGLGRWHVDHLMEVRARYGVSTEALFRRVVGLSETPATMFAATRTDTGLRTDYTIDGPAGGLGVPVDTPGSVLAAVDGPGQRTSGPEASVGGATVEAVGLGPWPGSRDTRIVGVVHTTGADTTDTTTIEVPGDVFPLPENTSSRPQMVLHLVTDSARRLHGGFASAVTTNMPDAVAVWAQLVKGLPLPLPLGRAFLAAPLTGPALCCLVAQEGYGRSAAPRIRYTALADALDEAAGLAVDLGAEVHAPRLGTGLAGGHWPVLREQFHRAFTARGVQVTVHVLGDDR